MKKILFTLLIVATLFASDPEMVDTNTTASAVSEHSEHGPLFAAAVIVGVPIVIAGGIVYYAVLTPIALTYWAFGIEPYRKKAQ